MGITIIMIFQLKELIPKDKKDIKNLKIINVKMIKIPEINLNY